MATRSTSAEKFAHTDNILTIDIKASDSDKDIVQLCEALNSKLSNTSPSYDKIIVNGSLFEILTAKDVGSCLINLVGSIPMRNIVVEVPDALSTNVEYCQELIDNIPTEVFRHITARIHTKGHKMLQGDNYDDSINTRGLLSAAGSNLELVVEITDATMTGLELFSYWVDKVVGNGYEIKFRLGDISDEQKLVFAGFIEARDLGMSLDGLVKPRVFHIDGNFYAPATVSVDGSVIDTRNGKRFGNLYTSSIQTLTKLNKESYSAQDELHISTYDDTENNTVVSENKFLGLITHLSRALSAENIFVMNTVISGAEPTEITAGYLGESIRLLQQNSIYTTIKTDLVRLSCNKYLSGVFTSGAELSRLIVDGEIDYFDDKKIVVKSLTGASAIKKLGSKVSLKVTVGDNNVSSDEEFVIFISRLIEIFGLNQVEIITTAICNIPDTLVGLVNISVSQHGDRTCSNPEYSNGGNSCGFVSIASNGNCYPCVGEYKTTGYVGNIFRTPMVEILSDRKSYFSNSSNKPPCDKICKTCSDETTDPINLPNSMEEYFGSDYYVNSQLIKYLGGDPNAGAPGVKINWGISFGGVSIGSSGVSVSAPSLNPIDHIKDAYEATQNVVDTASQAWEDIKDQAGRSYEDLTDAYNKAMKDIEAAHSQAMVDAVFSQAEVMRKIAGASNDLLRKSGLPGAETVANFVDKGLDLWDTVQSYYDEIVAWLIGDEARDRQRINDYREEIQAYVDAYQLRMEEFGAEASSMFMLPEIFTMAISNRSADYSEDFEEVFGKMQAKYEAMVKEYEQDYPLLNAISSAGWLGKILSSVIRLVSGFQKDVSTVLGGQATVDVFLKVLAIVVQVILIIVAVWYGVWTAAVLLIASLILSMDAMYSNGELLETIFEALDWVINDVMDLDSKVNENFKHISTDSEYYQEISAITRLIVAVAAAIASFGLDMGTGIATAIGTTAATAVGYLNTAYQAYQAYESVGNILGAAEEHRKIKERLEEYKAKLDFLYNKRMREKMMASYRDVDYSLTGAELMVARFTMQMFSGPAGDLDPSGTIPMNTRYARTDNGMSFGFESMFNYEAMAGGQDMAMGGLMSM